MNRLLAMLTIALLAGCGGSTSNGVDVVSATTEPPPATTVPLDASSVPYPAWGWTDGDELFESDISGRLELDGTCAYIVDDLGRTLLILPASRQTVIREGELIQERNGRTARSAEYEPGTDAFVVGDLVESAGGFGEGRRDDAWPTSCDYTSVLWSPGVWATAP